MKSKFFVVTLFVSLLMFSLSYAGNVGNVNQVGNNNESTTLQTGMDNTANTNQYGTNQGDITQTGNNNTSTINQGSVGKSVTNLHLPAYNGDWMHGAFIKQVGNFNDATTTMKESSNYAHIYQTGDRNMGSQDIGTYESKANGNLLDQVVGPHYGVTIDQTGNDNKATQVTNKSYGCYGIQDMRVVQSGDSNTSNQTSIGGMQSKMDAFQVGNLNLSTQYANGMVDVNTVNIIGNSNITDQEQPYVLWGSTYRTATIDILGNSNSVNQMQSGLNLTADVDISGNSNTVSQSQTGNFHYTKVSVSGNTNGVSQTQNGGNSNLATVTQSGNSNTATQVQTGSSNTSSITSTGNTNIASQTQLGNSNSAAISQSGNLNYAMQSQIGSGLSSVILQSGNGNFSSVVQH